MYTVSKVVNSNPDALSTAANEAQAGADRVDQNITTARKHLTELSEDWTGTASESAQKQGTDMLTDQTAYKQKLIDLVKPLTDGAQKLSAKRSELKSAVDDAETWWDVHDDGTVSPGFSLRVFANISVSNYLIVESHRIQVEQKIKLILAQFEAQDVSTAAEVQKIQWR